MKIIPLTALETAATGFSHKVVIGVSDLTAAGATTSTTISVLTLAAGQHVDKAGYKIATNIAGTTATSITNVTMSVGDNSVTNVWFSAADICQTSQATYGVASTSKQYTTTSTVQALITATGENLSAVTAGEVDLYLRVVDMAGLGF